MFRELEHPGLIVSNLTPNWFASIMGTGIVAVAAATTSGSAGSLPHRAASPSTVWRVVAVSSIGHAVRGCELQLVTPEGEAHEEVVSLIV